MNQQGRVRLNISRNTKGFTYDFTVEQSTDGKLPHRENLLRLLDEAEDFKEVLEAKVKAWTLALTEEE